MVWGFLYFYYLCPLNFLRIVTIMLTDLLTIISWF